MRDDLEHARSDHLARHAQDDSAGKAGRPTNIERQRRDHISSVARDDEWSDEARKKAAEARRGGTTGISSPDPRQRQEAIAGARRGQPAKVSPAGRRTGISSLDPHARREAIAKARYAARGD